MSEIRDSRSDQSSFWGFTTKAILFSCSHQILFSFFPVFPSWMILCYLLCSFHSSFYLLSSSEKQGVVLLVWIIGLSFFLLPYKYTAQLCTVYPRKCPNRWTKRFFLFHEKERNLKVNHFVGVVVGISVTKWRIWDLCVLVHVLCMWAVFDCPLSEKMMIAWEASIFNFL